MLDVMWDAAVLLSAHGPHLVERRTPLSDPAQHRYWSRSQARLRHWRKVLTEWRGQSPAQPDWPRLQLTLHALFTGEVLTRLAGTLMEASDRQRKTHNAGPIARNVFVAHLEVRQTALQLMMDGPHLSFEQVARLDTLRRRAERWSDALIGHLVVRYGVSSYAFDEHRARDFGSEQLRTATSARAHHQLWDLYRLSLRSAFEPYATPCLLEDQFRYELVAALFQWLPEGLFDQSGMALSPWVQRFLRTLLPDDQQDLSRPRSVLHPDRRALEDL